MPALLRRRSLADGREFARVRVPVIVEERIMGEKVAPCHCCPAVLYLSPVAASAFHLQEATIAHIHRAILAKELMGEDRSLPSSESTPIMNNTSKTDVEAGFVLGDIEPIEHTGNLRARQIGRRAGLRYQW
jgi:hypothetical protein